MFGRSQRLELERRCQELVVTGATQRRELRASCHQVASHFSWVDNALNVARRGSPWLLGAVGLAGAWFGRRRSTGGGLLTWAARIQWGIRAFSMVRNFLARRGS